MLIFPFYIPIRAAMKNPKNRSGNVPYMSIISAANNDRLVSQLTSQRPHTFHEYWRVQYVRGAFNKSPDVFCTGI